MTEIAPVEVSLHVAGTPTDVFGFFTDPARYVQWMGSEAELEPVPGGVYRVRMTDEDGGTRLVLRHDDLPSESLREGHDIAWNTYLPRLVLRAAGRDPGADPHS
jgi:uncharacterized protein YndB with AHSA1/START domain